MPPLLSSPPPAQHVVVGQFRRQLHQAVDLVPELYLANVLLHHLCHLDTVQVVQCHPDQSNGIICLIHQTLCRVDCHLLPLHCPKQCLGRASTLDRPGPLPCPTALPCPSPPPVPVPPCPCRCPNGPA